MPRGQVGQGKPPHRMTESNLKKFDKMTSREGPGVERERPLSPGVSSIKSSRSLHELGLADYPYPDIPTAPTAKLTRSQERQSLQNLNNRLAGYIDKVELKLISLCTNICTTGQKPRA